MPRFPRNGRSSANWATQAVIDAHSTELSAMRVLLLQALGENEHNEAHAIEAVTYLKARQEAQRRFNAQREAKNGR